ncbi:MAG TPA: nucleotide exchange factor GrpE [Candidatus Limnocylindria bacterium]|nr:nucleotide exchange factor GrpE [Candidatus Limnocylindria bacterium]
MDDTRARAEALLEERMRSRKTTNGDAAVDAGTADDEAPEPSRGDAEEALTNDLKRLAADFSNYRKRNEAERADFAKYAKSELIRKLLDVLDGYDRAIDAVPAELRDQPWVEGMWLVERKLRQILEQEGLSPIETLGQRFDPYVHEAVSTVPSDEPEGTVVGELQKGYRLHDRVLRPALVTVSQGRGETRGTTIEQGGE